MTQLVWPNGTRIEPPSTGAYGPRTPIWTSEGWTRPYHVGQDWVDINRLMAIGGGLVVQSSYISWAGWQVLIYLGKIDGIETWVRYCHLASRSHLNVGDRVGRGDLIGFEGATGQVTGKHLHMEIYRGAINRGSGANPGNTVDPRAFIRARLNATPTPTPAPEPEEEDEDMWKPTVHVRIDSGKPGEYTLAHPEIGADLKPGEKRTDGKITVFRGFMVTADLTIGLAWARMYAKGASGETSRTDRAGYIAIQAEAQRVSRELAG